MSIFDLRQSVIDEYSKYVQSFLSITDQRVRSFIEKSVLTIRLSLGPKAKADGANVLWDLIHEFGHVLQGVPEKKSRDPKRERDAWNRGWAYLIERFPHLVTYESEYFSHAEECLKGGK